MNFEERLADLCRRGQTQEAAELARAVLKNDAVRTVEVDDDAVRVETRRFRGVHRIARYGRDPVIHTRGEYRFEGNDVTFTFKTATMHAEALRRAMAALDADSVKSTDSTEPKEADVAASRDSDSPPERTDSIVAATTGERISRLLFGIFLP